MAGYNFEKKKFNLFLKSGLLLSILQNEKDNGFEVNESGIRVIDVQNQTPCSISTNWQLIIGAGIAYRLKRKISLSMEPQFRYYLNTEYQSGDGKIKKPYSFTIRAGILYNF